MKLAPRAWIESQPSIATPVCQTQNRAPRMRSTRVGPEVRFWEDSATVSRGLAVEKRAGNGRPHGTLDVMVVSAMAVLRTRERLCGQGFSLHSAAVPD